MPEPVVFYVKCKPGGADAWRTAENHGIVFVGYPPWKRSEDSRSAMRSGYANALFNVLKEPFCAGQLREYSPGYRRQVTCNARLAASVGPGAFVIVPRPDTGECHIAKVQGAFEVVDDPPWGQEYLNLRKKQGLDSEPVADHICDVVQCWRVSEWRSVPFPLIPRWISYRLLSRQTAGRIEGITQYDLNPVAVIGRLYNRDSESPKRRPTTVEQLLTWVSPSIFEHLVVRILQLEAESGERWHHVGGCGDGGVDGLAVSPDGTIVGAVQCKWHYSGNVELLASQMAMKIRHDCPKAMIVVAVLMPPKREPRGPNGVIYWDLQHITALVEKHQNALPIALTLGIREPCTT